MIQYFDNDSTMKGVVHNISALKCPKMTCCHILHWIVYLQYPKCFQQCSKPGKYAILFKITHFTWSPINAMIAPLPPSSCLCCSPTRMIPHYFMMSSSSSWLRDPLVKYFINITVDSSHVNATHLFILRTNVCIFLIMINFFGRKHCCLQIDLVILFDYLKDCSVCLFLPTSQQQTTMYADVSVFVFLFLFQFLVVVTFGWDKK